jgi:hypothetical protein
MPVVKNNKKDNPKMTNSNKEKIPETSLKQASGIDYY